MQNEGFFFFSFHVKKGEGVASVEYKLPKYSQLRSHAANKDNYPCSPTHFAHSSRERIHNYTYFFLRRSFIQ